MDFQFRAIYHVRTEMRQILEIGLKLKQHGLA